MRKSASKSRETLRKQIAAAATMEKKYEIAYGMPLWPSDRPRTRSELLKLVDRWRFLLGKSDGTNRIEKAFEALSVNAPTPNRDDYDSYWVADRAKEIALLGKLAALAIHNREHTFFSRLGEIIRYNIKPRGVRPDAAKLYQDILLYGCIDNTGTKEHPCYPKSLLQRLEHLGHKFEKSSQNEFPHSLRKVCKSLGFVLYSEGPGRPRKIHTV